MKKLTLILCASTLVAGSAIAMENSDAPAKIDLDFYLGLDDYPYTPATISAINRSCSKQTVVERRRPVLTQLIIAQSLGASSSDEQRTNPRYQPLSWKAPDITESDEQKLQESHGPRIEDVD